MRFLIFLILLCSTTARAQDSTMVRKYIVPQRDYYWLIEGDKKTRIYDGRLAHELSLREDLKPYLDLRRDYHYKSIRYNILYGLAFTGATASYLAPKWLGANKTITRIGYLGTISLGLLSLKLLGKSSRLVVQRNEMTKKIIAIYNYNP